MDLITPNRTCRLCLKLLNNHFTVLDEIAQSNLNSLLPFLNFSLTHKPVICESCTESVAHCLNFKARCMLNEDDVVLIGRNENNAEIFPQQFFYENKIENESTNDSGDCNVCHFCLKVTTCGSYLILEKDDVEMLPIYFPELDLGTVTEPGICMLCHKSLRRHFDFIKKCFQAQENIIDFHNLEGKDYKGRINLNNGTNFMLKNTIKNEREDIVKIEETCEDNKVDTNASCIVKKENNENLKQTEDITRKDETLSNIELIEYRSSQDPCTAKRASECELCPCNANTQQDLECGTATHNSLSEATVLDYKKCTFETKYLPVHDGIEEAPRSTCHVNVCLQVKRCNLPNHLRGCNLNKPKSQLKHVTSSPKSSSGAAALDSEQCTFETEHKSSLRQRMRIHDGIEEARKSKLTCHLCGLQVKQKGNLVNHLRACTNNLTKHKSQLKDVMVKCPECGFESKNQKSLFEHRKLHKEAFGTTMHGCPECSYQTKHKRYFRDHMVKHKNVCEVAMYRCTQCSYETMLQSLFQKHVVVHTCDAEVTMHKCMECDFQSKYYDSLHKHTSGHVRDSKKGMHTCAECKLKTSSQDPVDTAKRAGKCDLCPYTAKSPRELAYHLSSSHKSSPEVIALHREKCGFQLVHEDKNEVPVLTCSICGLQTQQNYKLIKYVRVHDGNPIRTTFKCPECGFESIHRKSMDRHKLIHKKISEARIHSCTECNFQTRHKRSLQRHELGHKMIPTMTLYRCAECSYETRSHTWLRKHMETHK